MQLEKRKFSGKVKLQSSMGPSGSWRYHSAQCVFVVVSMESTSKDISLESDLGALPGPSLCIPGPPHLDSECLKIT